MTVYKLNYQIKKKLLMNSRIKISK